ncbi:hypothetical protein THAOC_19136 [Thalassiosira oceanica]|uniref:Uncharacterized protein n=1 Tax=Thalassiosira oceanica TaxID=159749 RepID=K0SQ45_THAOC|nr:hypothetical protein THAOC_19136 [Thalassiosira oceanica]|eukprot:EJK60497.1 hypothetical protein THAOC_19136 [Thalassiosira oceanica]
MNIGETKSYDDQAIDDLMDEFLEGLKDAVLELEHGVCDSIAVCCADHDEDLMPHWKALFRSFDYINPYGAGVELCLHYIELNEEVMRRICNHIRRKNIRKVHFISNRFANMRGAIGELGNALKSQKIKSLTWSENPIESMEDMNLFTRVLSSNILDFRGNNLETNGRTDISDLIAVNSPLQELNLYRNRLNDDDAVLIAQSLGRNTHLAELYMNYSSIQERGMRALYEAVNDTSTLNALSDSNHTCRLEGLSGDFDLYAINSYSGSNGLYMNRMCKMHRVMAGRYRSGGGNVPHLNSEMRGEDFILLAPYLMESVVRRSDAFPKKYNKSSECSLGLLYELRCPAAELPSPVAWSHLTFPERTRLSQGKCSRDRTSSRPRGMFALRRHACPVFFQAVLEAIAGDGDMGSVAAAASTT